MRTSTIIGEILAAWEDAANVAAVDCHHNAEEDADKLLRHGVDLPEGATKDERAKATRAALKAIDNGRELAKAWRLISKGLRRFLRTLGVPTYSKRRNDAENEPAAPWENRRKHEAMGSNIDAPKHERANVVLDKDKLESTAREHGLWKDENDEPTNECIHVFNRCGSAMGEVHLERCSKCKKVRPIEARQ